MLKRLERAPRVVIYSAYCDGPLAAACVVAGADGLVSKGGVGAELCDAVRAVARGHSRLPIVPPTLAGAMRRRLGLDGAGDLRHAARRDRSSRDREHARNLAGRPRLAPVGDAAQARGVATRPGRRPAGPPRGRIRPAALAGVLSCCFTAYECDERRHLCARASGAAAVHPTAVPGGRRERPVAGRGRRGDDRPARSEPGLDVPPRRAKEPR